jgi:alkanesulfonate monooxygenase SsuD/methylene tetrahydromethanopterin reductase-like flavin-dependent oxidoreductase (luciferase family)
MDMLAEQLEIVHGQWTESPFSFAGAHYSLDAVDAQPKPVQSPHPPLIMGGKAGPRAAALAARWADEYNTAFATLDDAAADEGAGRRGVRGGGARGRSRSRS